MNETLQITTEGHSSTAPAWAEICHITFTSLMLKDKASAPVSLSWWLWQGSEGPEFQEQVCFSPTTTTTASQKHFTKSACKIQEQNVRESGCRQWPLWYQIKLDSSNTISHRSILGSAQFLTGSNLPPKVTQSWEGIKICKTWMLALSSAFCLCKSEPRISAVWLGLWEAGNMTAFKTAVQCSDP